MLTALRIAAALRAGDRQGAGGEGVARGWRTMRGEVRAGSDGDADSGEDDGEGAEGTARARREVVQCGTWGSSSRRGETEARLGGGPLGGRPELQSGRIGNFPGRSLGAALKEFCRDERRRAAAPAATSAPRPRRGGVAGSQSTAAPSPALLRTFSDSSAHFMRVAEMSMPSRSRTNERSSAARSSTLMPLTSSEAIDAAAWLIAQPWPSKRRSSTVLSSSTREHHLQLVAAQRVRVVELEVGVVHRRPSCGGACSARGSPRDRGRPSVAKILPDLGRGRRRARRRPRACCAPRRTRAWSRRRRGASSAAARSGGRRARRRPGEPRISATSCGWMPSSVNETSAPRASASSGPMTCTPGTAPRRSSA